MVKCVSLSNDVKVVLTPPDQKNLTLLVKLFETLSQFVANLALGGYQKAES